MLTLTRVLALIGWMYVVSLAGCSPAPADNAGGVVSGFPDLGDTLEEVFSDNRLLRNSFLTMALVEIVEDVPRERWARYHTSPYAIQAVRARVIRRLDRRGFLPDGSEVSLHWYRQHDASLIDFAQNRYAMNPPAQGSYMLVFGIGDDYVPPGLFVMCSFTLDGSRRTLTSVLGFPAGTDAEMLFDFAQRDLNGLAAESGSDAGRFD
jgi:hypothetical protein